MTESLNKAKKGKILTVSNTRGNYRAVVVKWEIRPPRQKFFYQVIRLTKDRSKRKPHWIGEPVILDATDESPEYSIGEKVKLSDRSGTIAEIEGDHFVIDVMNRSTGGRERPGKVTVTKWELISMNPKNFITID